MEIILFIPPQNTIHFNNVCFFFKSIYIFLKFQLHPLTYGLLRIKFHIFFFNLVFIELYQSNHLDYRVNPINSIFLFFLLMFFSILLFNIFIDCELGFMICFELFFSGLSRSHDSSQGFNELIRVDSDNFLVLFNFYFQFFPSTLS
jgi:hypothetical protein